MAQAVVHEGIFVGRGSLLTPPGRETGLMADVMYCPSIYLLSLHRGLSAHLSKSIKENA
jgi:hypothetical protein